MTCANCGVGFSDVVLGSDSIICGLTSNTRQNKRDLNLSISAGSGDTENIIKSESLAHDDPDHNDDDDDLAGNIFLLPIKEEVSPVRLQILDALSTIFEISPIRLMCEFGTNHTPDVEEVQVFKNLGDNGSSPQGARNFHFCSKCGECLSLLYNSFMDFVHTIKKEGEVGNRFKELETRRRKIKEDGGITFATTEEVAIEKGTTTTATAKRRRGRPRKVQLEVKHDDEMEEVGGINFKINDKNKREAASSERRIPQKKRRLSQARSVSGSDGEMREEHLTFIIKPDLQDESSNTSLSDDDFPSYGGGGRDSDDFSPPDSPINMDFEEVCPRSPRPVRRSSARNKDWSSYYKDDDEEEEEVLNVDNENCVADGVDLGDGNETEVTATEAEDDDGDEEIPHPDTDTILEEVQVAWKEEEDRRLDFDDDSDEDYVPDSDLENILAQETKPTRSKRFRKRLVKSSRINIYECDVCGNIFAHRKSLETHRRIHRFESVGLHECAVCFKDFSCDELLKRHRRQFHGEYIPYRMKGSDINFETLIEQAKKHECPICHELLQQSDLQTHVLEHNVENPWKCSLCPREYSTLAEFTRHNAVFHKQRRKFCCDVCLKEFRSNYHLNKHQRSIHTVRSDKQVREVSCDEEIENQNIESDDDNGNVDKVESSNRQHHIHKCDECGKKYAKLEQLTEHLILHGIGDKFKCEICGREFTHESSRKRHMLLHAEVNRFSCMEADCGKSFSRKDHLTRHMDNIHGIQITHHGEIVSFCDGKRTPKAKEIPCAYCQKLIKRERMRLHLVSHTGEKKHACKQCGQKFGLRTTLRTHIQCVHQDLRRYNCSFCSRAFKRSNHLKDHLKLHTEADNKPFQCEQCSKSFRREKNLKSHMVTHFGGKDFMCELCGKAFNRMDNMRAHVKSVHEGIQIRKKRPASSTKHRGSKVKKIKSGPDISSTKVEVDSEISFATPTLQAVVVADASQSISVMINTLKDEPAPLGESIIQQSMGASVIMTAANKPARKRGNRTKKSPQGETLALSTILNVQSESDTTQIQPGTIVTLAVDSNMGNVISTDGLSLGTVQIEEIHNTVDGESETFDADDQQTTIVELAPGQVFPATSGQYQTTYYQYTYYHQE